MRRERYNHEQKEKVEKWKTERTGEAGGKRRKGGEREKRKRGREGEEEKGKG